MEAVLDTHTTQPEEAQIKTNCGQLIDMMVDGRILRENTCTTVYDRLQRPWLCSRIAVLATGVLGEGGTRT